MAAKILHLQNADSLRSAWKNSGPSASNWYAFANTQFIKSLSCPSILCAPSFVLPKNNLQAKAFSIMRKLSLGKIARLIGTRPINFVPTGSRNRSCPRPWSDA